MLEPLFLKHGVDLVLTGHEHFYERIKPQQGINYIIAGSAAKLRRGDIGSSELTAKGFDEGYAFMLMEIVGDDAALPDHHRRRADHRLGHDAASQDHTTAAQRSPRVGITARRRRPG